MSIPVGTGNQRKQSDAVRLRIAFAQRDSETAFSESKDRARMTRVTRDVGGYGNDGRAAHRLRSLENEASAHAYAPQRGSNPRSCHLCALTPELSRAAKRRRLE